MMQISSQAEPSAPEFQKHGIAAPSGQAGWNGTHAVRGADGKREILVKLWTGTGATNRKTLLIVNAEDGSSVNLAPPDGARGEGAFGTFLSSKNRFYDMMAKGEVSSFYEYDVASRKWTARLPVSLEGNYRFAFNFTEADSGTIYVAIITEGGGLLSYDPESRKLMNLGRLIDADWLVYPHIITDSAGWIYVATAHKEANFITYSPTLDRTVRKVAEIEGTVKSVKVQRAENGWVYINFNNDEQLWYEGFEGKITRTQKPTYPVVLHQQGWRNWREFGDGSRIESIYVSSRTAEIEEKDGSRRTLKFDYESAGVPIYSLCAGADGKLYGSTGIPLRFFVYDPVNGKFSDYGIADYGGHINDLVSVGDTVYGAIYSSGGIIEAKPSEPWRDGVLQAEGNPRQIFSQPKGTDLFSRPYVMALHHGKGHLLVGGNPYRVNQGGGLLIYDLKARTSEIFPHTELIPQQAVKSIVSLADGTVIGGTSVEGATGGTESKEGAKLFVIDWEKRSVTHRIPFGAEMREIADLISPDGKLVVGVAEGSKSELFWFQNGDYEKIERRSLAELGAIAGTQSRRVLSIGPDGAVYLLLRNGIVRFDPASGALRKVAESPVSISTGSAWSHGRLYFTSGVDLWSWAPAVGPTTSQE